MVVQVVPSDVVHFVVKSQHKSSLLTSWFSQVFYNASFVVEQQYKLLLLTSWNSSTSCCFSRRFLRRGTAVPVVAFDVVSFVVEQQYKLLLLTSFPSTQAAQLEAFLSQKVRKRKPFSGIAKVKRLLHPCARVGEVGVSTPKVLQVLRRRKTSIGLRKKLLMSRGNSGSRMELGLKESAESYGLSY
ncbi:hypothetical protein CEXT_799841 [Caerostris extrusa]|uniref:Uncharacterized protein n=1 Tax=Caerostris extrusa TaxID=172846 RepID=A0AAV4U023_CAEEX|nr:hypothetical protein CEXT_799841 [Caerostris extrusa]